MHKKGAAAAAPFDYFIRLYLLGVVLPGQPSHADRKP